MRQVVDDDHGHGTGVLGVFHFFGKKTGAAIDDRDLAHNLGVIDQGVAAQGRVARGIGKLDGPAKGEGGLSAQEKV